MRLRGRTRRSNSSRENPWKSGSPKRAGDDWQITGFGPRQQCDFLTGAEGLEQQEDAEKYGNDTGPDHRERPENEEERDRRQRVLDELAVFCGHGVLLRGLIICTPT